MNTISRRHFLANATRGLCAAGAALNYPLLLAQDPGQRPKADPNVVVVNPQGRVPVGLIIDDSTCLVNLNRFAMPQFDRAFDGKNAAYKKNWRDWPVEIPDDFVRKFGEWTAEHGVKGKYSIVPYPACVGRLDRMLPGWTQRELEQSIELVRTLMAPNWDIHPEMITHTRVIDLKTGHPYRDHSLQFMENWDWTTGKSVQEMTDYLAYALSILKAIDLPCEGVTTPGGFGNRARPQLAQGTLNAVRDVFGADIPHYFRDLYDRGDQNVAPLVQNASGLDSANPKCVVSIIGCTGDWTGGWDCSTPGGADLFITEDLERGRMVDVIQRAQPALMVCHWTGIYWNGQELGFKIFKEVVRRLQARFDNLIWMKLSEVARYWAAKELTQIERNDSAVRLKAPFACSQFTLRFEAAEQRTPRFGGVTGTTALDQVTHPNKLKPGTWCREGRFVTVCFALPRGDSRIELV